MSSEPQGAWLLDTGMAFTCNAAQLGEGERKSVSVYVCVLQLQPGLSRNVQQIDK